MIRSDTNFGEILLPLRTWTNPNLKLCDNILCNSFWRGIAHTIVSCWPSIWEIKLHLLPILGLHRLHLQLVMSTHLHHICTLFWELLLEFRSYFCCYLFNLCNCANSEEPSCYKKHSKSPLATELLVQNRETVSWLSITLLNILHHTTARMHEHEPISVEMKFKQTIEKSETIQDDGKDDDSSR